MLACFSAGAFAVLAMPPIGFFPILLFCLPVFYILGCERAPTLRSGFMRAWAFGAGYFIFGLYWISYALFVDFEKFKWVLPFSLMIGPAAFALLYGLIPPFAHIFKKLRCHPALAFVISFSAIEYVRGHVLTGFPWNLIGYSWDHVLPLMQISAWIGIYGLTALTIFWSLTPMFWRQRTLRVLSITSFMLCLFYGLIVTQAEVKNTPHLIRIVQASIPQDMKWDGDAEWRNLEKHITLSKQATENGDKITAVIWPETAVTTDMQLFPEVARYIGSQLPPDSIGLLGNLRFTLNTTKSAPEKYFNSLSVLNKKGDVLATYDKHHLVPFGEYIPFRDKIKLTPLALVVSGFGDFTAGTGARTIRPVTGFPAFSPLICYEVIFPAHSLDPNDRPEWLVNVTNDAWYGHTAGPYQHLSISRVRAIETGLPLARAANNGISAMIDPYGRVLKSLPLDAVDVIDAKLPAALSAPLYQRIGDLAVLIILLAFLALGYQRKADHADLR